MAAQFYKVTRLVQVTEFTHVIAESKADATRKAGEDANWQRESPARETGRTVEAIPLGVLPGVEVINQVRRANGLPPLPVSHEFPPPPP